MAYLVVTGAKKPGPYPYMSNEEGDGPFDEKVDCDLDKMLKNKMQQPLPHWSKFCLYVRFQCI
jgi:hypothetical protein